MTGVNEFFPELRELDIAQKLAPVIRTFVDRSGREPHGYADFLADVLRDSAARSVDGQTVRHLAAVVLLGKYPDEDDNTYLDIAIEILRQLIDQSSETDPKSAQYYSDLGGAYAIQHDRSRSIDDRGRRANAWRTACRMVQDSDPEFVLDLAGRWGTLAKYEDNWPEAAEAFELALSASERLVEEQAAYRGKREWLLKSKGLAAEASYAHIKCDAIGRAILAVERGRAVIRTQLGREEVDLEHAEPQLKARYLEARAVVERYRGQVNRKFATPPSLADQRRAQRRLLDAVHELALSEGIEVACGTNVESIIDCAQQGPVVYITSAELGGICLIAQMDRSLDFVPLPQASSGAVDQRVEEALDEAASLAVALQARGANPRDALYTASLTIVTDMCSWLWDVVMAPLLDKLQSDLPVTLIPTGVLAVWPLHAAWTEDDSRPSGKRYASDIACFKYAPNGYVLSRCHEIVARADGDQDSILVVEQPTPVSAPHLKYASFECTAILALYPKPNTQLLRGPDATVERITMAAQDHKAVHFCCHGLADPDHPFSSGLLMANDERLSIRHLEALRPTCARLAVLSTCEGGLPGLELPDEVETLPNALLHAGFGAVIGALWSVPDLSTMLLITRFYQLWRLQPLGPPEALREAQRWLREAKLVELLKEFPAAAPEIFAASEGMSGAEDRPFWHPEHWAAFVYVGA